MYGIFKSPEEFLKTQTPEKFTAKDIEHAVWSTYNSSTFNFQQYLGVCHATGITGWESDLLLVSKSDYLTEVEVKISVADFKREFTAKAKKHECIKQGKTGRRAQGIISRYYFAIPSDLWVKIHDMIPEEYGIIVVYKRHSRTKLPLAHVVRHSKRFDARKVTEKEKQKIILANYYHYHARKIKMYLQGLDKPVQQEG